MSQTSDPLRQALGRAMRMKSGFITSSIPARVSRIGAARLDSATVAVGRMKLRQLSWPEIESSRAKLQTPGSASGRDQKLGIAWPAVAKASAPRSIQLFGWVAAQHADWDREDEDQDQREHSELCASPAMHGR